MGSLSSLNKEALVGLAAKGALNLGKKLWKNLS